MSPFADQGNFATLEKNVAWGSGVLGTLQSALDGWGVERLFRPPGVRRFGHGECNFEIVSTEFLEL